MLTASYNAGTTPWDPSNPSDGAHAKIWSSTASVPANNRTLGWMDDGVSQVTVMQTIAGDANLDGQVTFADLNLVLAHYNAAGIWDTGDLNYDGQVTFADLNLVLAHYNASMGPDPSLGQVVNGANLDGQAIAALSADGFKVVPEPSTLALLLAGLMGLLAYAWRRRPQPRVVSSDHPLMTSSRRVEKSYHFLGTRPDRQNAPKVVSRAA